MLCRMLLMWKSLAYSFNRYLSPVITIIGFLLLNVLNTIGLILDNVLFPSIHKVKISKPIVIVGNPRSGTTFMHRFLVDQGFGAGMRIWKMLYPSLSLQKLVKPFLPLMEKISPARHHISKIHRTNLTAVETDDPALLFRFFDGFFVYGFFLAWAKNDLKSMFDPSIRDTSNRDFNYLEKIWSRNLISEGKARAIPKLFSLSVRIPQFIDKFPDAKIVYMVRDPMETVPSGLSLVTSVLDKRFGFWSLQKEKRQLYINRLYSGLLDLSQTFCDDFINDKFPRKNLKIVPYQRLMNDFERLMNEISEFVEVPLTEQLIKVISETGAKQRSYKSDHVYDLKRFGLSKEMILNDYKRIYDTFLS